MDMISKLFLWVLYSSIAAGILSLIIILIKLIFNDRIGPRFHHALWLLVLIRLLAPVVPESPLSILNLLPAKIQNVIDSKKTAVLDASAFSAEGYDHDISGEVNSYRDHGRNYYENDYVLSFEEYSKDQGKETSAGYALRIASLTWFAGFLSMALFALTAMFKFKGKAIYFRRLAEPEIVSLLEDCLKKLEIKSGIPIYTDESFKSPCISGIIRPRIYLPEGICSKISGKQLMHILLHELVHYKRRDSVYNLLGTIAVMVHWFNPVVWFAAKRMKLLREIASDAYVLEILGEEEIMPYGMTMVNLSRMFFNEHSQLSLISFFETKNQIKRRIHMIKAFKKGSYKISAAAVICCILIGSITLTNAVSSSSITDSGIMTAEKSPDMLIDKAPADEAEFLIDAPLKSYNDINKMAKVAGFKFKVPDFVPSDYNPSAFHIIKAYEGTNAVKIFFDKESGKRLSFAFHASTKDLKGFFKESAKNEYMGNENIQSEINSNEEPLGYGSLKGSILTITAIMADDESSWETTKKYLLWQDEDIFYGIEYIRDIKTPKGDINKRTDLSQEDAMKIAESVKYLPHIKNVDYVPITPEISTEIGQLSIYDKEDLEKAKTLLGFPIKFPLTIPKDIKASYASVGISPDSDIKGNKINYELVMIYKLPNDSLTFVQREGSKIYDHAREKGYFELSIGKADESNKIKTQSLLISGKDVLRYELTYEDKICETDYIWKENGFYCTVSFSPEAENQEEILKSLISEKVINSDTGQ
ncbi:M56 family metallopeptidase [Lutispora saccharofermentans]|uniref:M56 family metallopeptidase n=1 Tax=Lutispora saccharofermentans TaxID=3024236 RepID=A0ABT1NBN7_9FIRM|nr:M56 family metallopeptidase [Lutispora saccharofermentans]MCQ1528672.1 M56 family metallopeptidase [Lutispora saccharofermentans]